MLDELETSGDESPFGLRVHFAKNLDYVKYVSGMESYSH